MKVALDANLLAYAEAVRRAAADDEKIRSVRRMLATLPRAATVVPVQVLGELYNVLRRDGWQADAARAAVLDWTEGVEIVATSARVLSDALDLAARNGFQVWDAIILAGAADAGCTLLLGGHAAGLRPSRGDDRESPRAHAPSEACGAAGRTLRRRIPPLHAGPPPHMPPI